MDALFRNVQVGYSPYFAFRDGQHSDTLIVQRSYKLGGRTQLRIDIEDDNVGIDVVGIERQAISLPPPTLRIANLTLMFVYV